MYVVAFLGHALLAAYGPYDITLRECNARVELWVKLYMIDSPMGGVTYQCLEKRNQRRRISYTRP